MKSGSLVDRKRAINRFCEKCISPKPEDKRFINDNMAKLADAYLDLIKTSNNKVNETALKGLHKCLHPQSSFLMTPAFRDHVPNFIQAIVGHLRGFILSPKVCEIATSRSMRAYDVLKTTQKAPFPLRLQLPNVLNGQTSRTSPRSHDRRPRCPNHLPTFSE